MSTYLYDSAMFTSSGLSDTSIGSPKYPIRVIVSLPTSCTFGNETGDEENPITINWAEEETGYICGRCASGNTEHETEYYGGCLVKEQITCSKCGHFFIKKCSDTDEDYGTCFETTKQDTNAEACGDCPVDMSGAVSKPRRPVSCGYCIVFKCNK